PKTADGRYRLSAAKYQEAYTIRQGHYPGINLAALCLIRAGVARKLKLPEEEKKLRDQMEGEVKDLLSRQSDGPADYGDQDRNLWHPVTRADIHLLQQEWDDAVQLYRSACQSAQTWAKGTIGKQVVRIRDAWLALGESEVKRINQLSDLFP